MRETTQFDGLLRPGEVADLLGVSPITLRRWSKAGLLTQIRTPGGHHRYLQSEVNAFFARAAASRNSNRFR